MAHGLFLLCCDSGPAFHLAAVLVQEREDQVAAREANLKTTQEAVAAQQGAAQVCGNNQQMECATAGATPGVGPGLFGSFNILPAAPCLATQALSIQGCASPLQVEVARLEQSLRSLNKQLGEAEADYLTGTERLAALRREVSSRHRKVTGPTLNHRKPLKPAMHLSLPALSVVQG